MTVIVVHIFAETKRLLYKEAAVPWQWGGKAQKFGIQEVAHRELFCQSSEEALTLKFSASQCQSFYGRNMTIDGFLLRAGRRWKNKDL